MSQLLCIIDSLLFAVKPGETVTRQLLDPAEYLIVTQQKFYCGQIIFQDDFIIKFRTEDMKPVKILKKNIKEISIVKRAYVTVA